MHDIAMKSPARLGKQVQAKSEPVAAHGRNHAPNHAALNLAAPGIAALAPMPPMARHDGVALWRQIASQVHQAIGAGTYAPGARLPTEAELSHHFGVNRHTVRRALEELSRAGLVRVEQGRGSFVTEDVLEYAVEPRTRFSEWIRKHNKEPSGRVLQLKETVATAQ